MSWYTARLSEDESVVPTVGLMTHEEHTRIRPTQPNDVAILVDSSLSFFFRVQRDFDTTPSLPSRVPMLFAEMPR